jgi:hypothetical protein
VDRWRRRPVGDDDDPDLMRILQGSLTLGDTTQGLPITAYSYTSANSIQTVEYPRAESSTFIPRRNRTTEVSFSVSKLHLSRAAAEQYCAYITTKILEKATLTILCTSGNSVVYSILLKNAVLSGFTSTMIGCTVNISYRFTAGVPTL